MRDLLQESLKLVLKIADSDCGLPSLLITIGVVVEGCCCYYYYRPGNKVGVGDKLKHKGKVLRGR